MRVISLWQPYASLLVLGFKLIETRPYPCPPALVGTRLGIASTKQIKPEQKALFADAAFQGYYKETGLPGSLEEMPNGFLMGSVLIHSSDLITEEDLDDVTDEEQKFGDWRLGRYAWRTRAPEALKEPIPVMGQQGIWTLPDAKILGLHRTAKEG
jgi:hypothetical protein